MDFSTPPRRPHTESIVPMINVVFLLLIFFLMTSNLARPEPFDVTPPAATSDTEPEVEHVLYVDKSGKTSFEGAEGVAALTAISALSATNQVIQVRADAELEARVLAGLLQKLVAAGLSRVELSVTAR
ncbi:outer membrane transport energization protein ExbD [Ruegeria halocynthiae]|uniref:Outer membrane transport energization protein ExbD n=1 Tax=Ruegeria halocynthiae TaxID=985054 RepID=A0A1H2XYZ9_9RHOB|nr:biopolymer transporter ExbD [Ruegeria halocynthiae]SDW98182.1 outer membrane transport energization protein ExbD [Ruegeria halocynthiae]